MAKFGLQRKKINGFSKCVTRKQFNEGHFGRDAYGMYGARENEVRVVSAYALISAGRLGLAAEGKDRQNQ